MELIIEPKEIFIEQEETDNVCGIDGCGFDGCGINI